MAVVRCSRHRAAPGAAVAENEIEVVVEIPGGWGLEGVEAAAAELEACRRRYRERS